MAESLAEQIAQLSPEEQAVVLADMDPESLIYDWRFWGRPEQHAPSDDDWDIWIYLAGRGAGKTRSAAEWVREEARSRLPDGSIKRFALVARAAAETRDVLVLGESGILSIGAPSERPEYFPSKRSLVWPNGNQATLFTADEPSQLRGPQFRLAVDTPVPTPQGWTTMGELEAGNIVYDELGQPTLVTAVHDVMLAPDSYRLTFSDGTHIDADGGHRWKTLTATDLRYVTTHFGGEIPRDWATTPFGRESHNHEVKDTEQLRAHKDKQYIPNTRALAGNTESLPIAPWVLGIVLGDGASAAPSNIATHHDDQEWLVSELKAEGFEARATSHDHVWAPGLMALWRALGLYKNKHIPDAYLRASFSDRLALLQGLIDSDGGVEPSGAFRFYNTNKRLIDGAAELARSLGLVARVYERDVRTRSKQRSWFVQLNSSIPLARNPRKADAAKYSWTHRSLGGRYIRSIERIEPRLMRCITVDSESHLYLAGEGMVPTSNTHAWGDELAAWRRLPDDSGLTAWDNLRIATRLGPHPRIMATTTPKRVPMLYDLMQEQERTPGKIVITRGSTYDNKSNMAESYLRSITGMYEGTAIAAQELYGEMMDERTGALWTDEMVLNAESSEFPSHAPFRVIGVDPTVAERPGDECGIVVCASTGEYDLYKRQAWVLKDATLKGSTEEWASKVVEMARRYQCPVVAETNQGGALVLNAIRAFDPTVKVFGVHSKQGKALRAEPVALAYEQERVHHMPGLTKLETQMTNWIPGEGKSPDRIDALVHALTALLINPPQGFMGGGITARSMSSRRLPTPAVGGGTRKGSTFRVR